MLHKVLPSFESVDEFVKCGHSKEQYFPKVLLNYAVQGNYNF